MATRRKEKDAPSIDQAEWDFTNCPEDEREYCRRYEFARHDDGVKKEIAEWRKNDRWRSGLSPEHWDFYTEKATLTFFRLFPEFPDTPWLKIPATDRKKRCAECRLLEGPFLEVSPERIDPDADYPYFPPDTGFLTPHRVYVVEINFSASKDAIKKAFERWLDSVHKSTELVKESRGGLTDADVLKALGAYRLSKHFGGDWEKAAEHSADCLKNGERLYKLQSEWIKARRKVEKFMANGVTPAPTASLLARLDLSKLSSDERVLVKVHIMKNVGRAEARRLNTLPPEAALTELCAVALAHKKVS